MNRPRLLPLLAAASLLLSASALAHQPILSDGTAVDADSAIPIADPDLSQVVYHEVTAAAPRLWITFDGTAGMDFYFQLGLPVIDRLENYRPALALVGPGLPPADLPFAIPAGLGAIVVTSADITEPEFFHEPFSGTDSWILFEREEPLPADGQYYLVAYVPAEQEGKLWMAFGRREEFGLDDFGRLAEILPQVRAFHEVSAASALPCFLLPATLALVGVGLALLAAGRLRSSKPR